MFPMREEPIVNFGCMKKNNLLLLLLLLLLNEILDTSPILIKETLL